VELLDGVESNAFKGLRGTFLLWQASCLDHAPVNLCKYFGRFWRLPCLQRSLIVRVIGRARECSLILSPVSLCPCLEQQHLSHTSSSSSLLLSLLSPFFLLPFSFSPSPDKKNSPSWSSVWTTAFTTAQTGDLTAASHVLATAAGKSVSEVLATGVPNQLSYGFVAGFASGYSAKKVSKVATFVFGTGFCIMQ